MWLVNALLLLASSLLTSSMLHRHCRSRTRPRPPGPKGLPIIGNIHQLPKTCLWDTVSAWRKEFGDMIYIETIGRPMLFLNAYEDAVELLANRSSKYSSRPHNVMAIELQGWDWLTINVPYGETFRKQRMYQRLYVNSPETSLAYLELQLDKSRKLLAALLDSPQEYQDHVRNLPGSVIMLGLYGRQVEKNDKYLELGMNSVRIVSEAAEKYFLLEVLPWLKNTPEWIPFVDFHRVAKAGREVSRAMHYDLYELTKKKLEEGSAIESMTSLFISENMQHDGFINDEDSYSGGMTTLFIGAVDTTVTAIMSFFLAMLKHPEAQRSAQIEIDRVVGTDRLPTFEDEKNLHYVRAMCTEILRFAMIAPLGHPHFTTEDDYYKGYFIPAGTTVFANIWEMGKNPDLNEDHRLFKPERWLSSEGNDDISINPRNYVFGFGRRICPGQKWAEHLLFITVASVLAAFNIEKDIDATGKEIPPNEDYLQTFVRMLGPSKCRITPRSQKMAALVKLSAEEK